MRAYFTMTLLSIVGLFVGAIFVQNASARVWTSGKYTVDADILVPKTESFVFEPEMVRKS